MTIIHQPLPVKGYKMQSADAVALANEGKELEERVLRWLDRLGQQTLDKGADVVCDQRMVALGRTNVQQGFMWAVRSIFQPARVALPEDDA